MKKILGLAFLAISFNAYSGVITTADLTGTETVEGFENLATDANLTTWFGGWRTPSDGYQFDSGVSFESLSSPNNNGDIIIGDTTLGSVDFGTSNGGSFSSSFLPGGTAYIADDGPGIGMGFVFDDVVNLAGMYVAGSDSITISAFDITNTLIESFTTNSMASVSNWQSNFLGLEASGIKSVQFTSSGDYWIADNLTFSQSVSVPEPSALSLLGLGLVGLVFLRRKIS